MLTQRRPVQRGDPVGATVELRRSRDVPHHEANHFHTNVKTKGGRSSYDKYAGGACVTSHTPTSAVSFGISAKYQEMTSRALSASGDVQSRNSSHRTASAVFGTAPACDSRSIAVRCAVCDLPPTASVTNIAS